MKIWDSFLLQEIRKVDLCSSQGCESTTVRRMWRPRWSLRRNCSLGTRKWPSFRAFCNTKAPQFFKSKNHFFGKKDRFLPPYTPSDLRTIFVYTQGVTDHYFVSSYWTFCPVIWLFGDVELWDFCWTCLRKVVVFVCWGCNSSVVERCPARTSSTQGNCRI